MRLLKVIISVISLQLISVSAYAAVVPVPEAGTFWMFGAALVAMAIAQRRHRHKKDDD